VGHGVEVIDPFATINKYTCICVILCQSTKNISATKTCINEDYENLKKSVIYIPKYRKVIIIVILM